MKKQTKKDFSKFTKRNTHKRRDKEAARRELMRAVAETEVAYSGIVLKDTLDLGRRGRVSTKARADEMVARGIFSGSKSGFGFVTLESGYDRDIFIPEGRTLSAIDGDFVEIIFHVYHNYLGEEKTEGRVTKIIEFGRKYVVGTLTVERSYHSRGGAKIYVSPDDPKINVKPIITDTKGARRGDKVRVRLLRGGAGGYSPEAEIVDNFGDTTTKDANYKAILAECEIPTEFTAEELEEAGRVAKMPILHDDRATFGNQFIMTIDGAGAKDLDDAVSLRRTKSGWQLSVHIADVSYYVREKTVLDRLVMNRGTSVYFTDKVVLMLPESLSNGACSLNAGEEKYTLSAVIDLDESGKICKTKVVPSVIISKLRGVYSEVNAVLDGSADAQLRAKYKSAMPTLLKMKELYEILEKKSRSRGYIDMNAPEAAVVLDDNGDVCDIVRIERGVGERMIEQFMLTANEAVATLLYESEIPCVYRIHEKPAPDKLETLADYLDHLGLDADRIADERAESSDFAAVLDEAREKGIDVAVSRTMLRSMMKAKYSEERMPHFGLGIQNYCHFTSPIRRLSDLATHRIIHRVLIEGKRAEGYRSYARRAARAATDSELRALNAERRIENLYKVIYMSSRIGECFDATVSSVTSFGLFAELDNTCEGLIPMSEMPGLFRFYENELSIRDGSLAFMIGDRARVRLEEADVVRGKLRFSLVL